MYKKKVYNFSLLEKFPFITSCHKLHSLIVVRPSPGSLTSPCSCSWSCFRKPPSWWLSFLGRFIWMSVSLWLASPSPRCLSNPCGSVCWRPAFLPCWLWQFSPCFRCPPSWFERSAQWSASLGCLFLWSAWWFASWSLWFGRSFAHLAFWFVWFASSFRSLLLYGLSLRLLCVFRGLAGCFALLQISFWFYRFHSRRPYMGCVCLFLIYVEVLKIWNYFRLLLTSLTCF